MKKVLIANRGEIAVRIQRACEKLSLSYVQCVSEVDRSSYPARRAGELALLPGNRADETYLNIPSILEAAKKHGCDSVHPGYGFLSENPSFADEVVKQGLIWIGPSAASIRALGTKTNARELVQKYGVPVTPGSPALDDSGLLEAADVVGFPIIIKATAGGGGRGMRVVRNREELRAALPNARAEALKNFANQAVYLERFIENPRHVEVQIVGDTFGNIVHLGTRDCSAQRRHQKLIEEAPAPHLSESMRTAIHESAVNAARSAQYHSAGTAEFLVKGNEFFFLEMNTRIQVEHPVTEEITGIDLVELQIRIAKGERLPVVQEEIAFNGHAIELRVNAESAGEGFRPAIGQISGIRKFRAPWLREEAGYESGDEISPYYDSLIAKLIVHGRNREEAIFRAYQAAKSYQVYGLDTALPFHVWMLATEDFQKGGFDIGFVEREFSAESLEELPALLFEDPNHIEPKSDTEPMHVERVMVREGIIIDIVHEPGGTFLALPAESEPSSNDSNVQRSTSRRTLLKVAGEGCK